MRRITRKQDNGASGNRTYSFDEYVYGAVAETGDELVKAIGAADMMEDKRNAFRERFMEACDGHATERVLDLLRR